MLENFKIVISENPWLWACALMGSALFLLQFLFNLLGNGESDELGSTETDVFQIKWLSKQAIAGFLMMFGWTALTCEKEFYLSKGPALLIASAVGILTVIINGFLFKGARKLHSSGNVFKIEETIGKEATVYQRIPKEGAGKITISLHGLTYEIDAVSEQGQEFPSFTRVCVLKKASDHTVVVTSIE